MAWAGRVATRLRIGESTPFSAGRLRSAAWLAWPSLIIPVLVIGGILGGLFTATEASVVAVLYVLFLAIATRELGLRRLFTLTEDSISLFSLSLLCVAAASLWGWVLAYYAVPQTVVSWLGQLGLLGSTVGIFVTVIAVFLIVGTFMDAVPAIIIL